MTLYKSSIKFIAGSATLAIGFTNTDLCNYLKIYPKTKRQFTELESQSLLKDQKFLNHFTSQYAIIITLLCKACKGKDFNIEVSHL